jgi:hypothetical protein
MNKLRQFFLLCIFAAVLVSFASGVHAQAQATSGSDQFFVVSSVQPKLLVLLRPTETTAIVAVNDKTKVVDQQGNAIKVSDLRAGDTIFVTYSAGPGGTMVATYVRKGIMTVAELRKRYVPSLPATAGQTGPGH